MNTPDNPWDSEAAWIAREEGGLVNEFYDRVILRLLRLGGSRPLADFLLKGHEPGPTVRRYIALMMLNRDDFANRSPADSNLFPDDEMPFRFDIKSRSGKKGRHFEPEKQQVAQLAPTLGYEAAIARVKEAINESGGAVGEQTIRDAYDQRYGNKSNN